MRFILTLFLIYIFWQIFKVVFRLAFRYWLRKNGGQFYYHSSGPGGYSGQSYRGNPGEIHVDTPYQSGTKKSRKTDHQVGEYIEFEEVK